LAVLVDTRLENFFDVLAENNRLRNTNEIIDAFGALMASHRKEVHCVVTSAKALDASTLKQVEGALKGFAKKGETLKITSKTDPSIKGGLVVEVGDRFIDMSTATRVRKMANALRSS